MPFFPLPLTVLVLLPLASASVRAQGRETATVELAGDVLQELASIPGKSIPPSLMADAQGVAIIPDVIKAGFVIGGRHGRGILLVRQPDGAWSNPLFITLAGGSVGWQIGVQSTDVVLVFKTRGGLNRIMRGQSKLTLGADIAVAAGPVGRQAEADTDAKLKAEIFSYSRSRGLFAGVALEGAALMVNTDSDDRFYAKPGITAREILDRPLLAVPALTRVQTELSRMSATPPPLISTPPPLNFSPPVPTPVAPQPQWEPVPTAPRPLPPGSPLKP